jgi:hypothetical protein
MELALNRYVEGNTAVHRNRDRRTGMIDEPIHRFSPQLYAFDVRHCYARISAFA